MLITYVSILDGPIRNSWLTCAASLANIDHHATQQLQRQYSLDPAGRCLGVAWSAHSYFDFQSRVCWVDDGVPGRSPNLEFGLARKYALKLVPRAS